VARGPQRVRAVGRRALARPWPRKKSKKRKNTSILGDTHRLHSASLASPWCAAAILQAEVVRVREEASVDGRRRGGVVTRTTSAPALYRVPCAISVRARTSRSPTTPAINGAELGSTAAPTEVMLHRVAAGAYASTDRVAATDDARFEVRGRREGGGHGGGRLLRLAVARRPTPRHTAQPTRPSARPPRYY
jgi:hypothetical protein